MKKTQAIALALMPAALFADIITWTGDGGNASWSVLANWVASSTGSAPDHVPLSGANSGDQVVISGAGVRVEYDGGDPWIGVGESITVSDGAMFVQTVASWWHGADGSVNISGGTFDTGSCSGTHAWSSFTVENGGTLIARTTIPDANVTVDATSTYEMITANGFAHTGTEKFTRFTATNQGAELSANAETASFDDDIVWTVRLISAAGVAIHWNAGSLVTWDTAYGGYYNAGGTIDIASGWTGSFTFAYPPAGVFASCFQNKITFDGAALTAESFSEIFTVEPTTVTDPNGTVHSASRVFLTPSSDWKIGAVTATDVSAAGATISATIASVVSGADYSVLAAYGTGDITESVLLAEGAEVEVVDGVCSNILSGLAENTPYNYAFGIVTNGAVAAFKSASFVASDYDYVFIGGAWAGGRTPTLGGASMESVLFADDFVTADELRGDNKMVREATLTSDTLIYGPLQVVNAAVVNTRSYRMNQAPYGFYGDNAIPLDFSSASGAGVFLRAPSYTFRCTDSQYDAFYASEIASGKLTLEGGPISAGDYAARFSLAAAVATEDGTIEADGETQTVAMKVATLTCWDILPANASGSWTLKDGARVRLAAPARLDALVAETGDVKIDLADGVLRVNSLVVDGVKLKGTYTAATLGILEGSGRLEVAAAGTLILLR